MNFQTWKDMDKPYASGGTDIAKWKKPIWKACVLWVYVYDILEKAKF